MSEQHRADSSPLERTFAHLPTIGAYPLTLLQADGELDLLNTAKPPITQRPYVVLEVATASPEHQTAIYKACFKEQHFIEAANEAYFLMVGTSLIANQLPGHVAANVMFPAFLNGNTNADPPYLLQTKIEGYQMGQIAGPHPNLLASDVITIAELITACGRVDPASLQALAPFQLEGPHLTQHLQCNTKQNYIAQLFTWEDAILPIVGETLWERLVTTLYDSIQSDALNHPPVFAAGDINFSNIIKTPQGKLGFIDWERIRITDSPVLDYGFILATLKDFPHHRRLFFNHACHLNQETAHFKELLRLDFLFNRGLGAITWRHERIQETFDPQVKAMYSHQIKDHIRELSEALNRQGLWGS